MGSICTGAHYYTKPRSRFVKPTVEAPRQVIGFDLSPKGGKPGMLPPDSNEDHVFGGEKCGEGNFNCGNSCSISSKTSTHKSNSATATSPRSALQQLLLPPLPQSEPAISFPLANVIGPASGTQPAGKSQPAKECSTVGMPALTTMKPCADPVPAALNLNWPISKGIAELVAPQHSSTFISNGKHGGSSAGIVSGIKSVAGNGKKSFQVETMMTPHELPWTSEMNRKDSSWIFKDQLHEFSPCRDKSQNSIWMKEVLMIGADYCSKSDGVDMSWKQQANMNIPEKSKKTSLFVLSASSPLVERSKHYHLTGADEYNPYDVDMDFLNSCYLCKRLLGRGHDVFMYSGDKAFCSMECRYQQIVLDERKERHAPLVIRSGNSPVYQSYMVVAGADADPSAAIATTHHPITVNRPNYMNSAAAA